MKIAPPPIYHTLRFQITAVIILLISVLVINTLFSFYSESQRRHDYTRYKAPVAHSSYSAPLLAAALNTPAPHPEIGTPTSAIWACMGKI